MIQIPRIINEEISLVNKNMNIFKNLLNKTLGFCFFFNMFFHLSLLLPTQLSAQENHPELAPPVLRFNFNINPGLDVYFAPKLLSFLNHNFDTVLERNGFSPSSFYSTEFNLNTGEKTLNDIIENPKSLSSIKKMRYYFRKFFKGFRIRNTHNFDLSIDGIDLSANWARFGIEIKQDPNVENKIIAILHLEADRLSLNLRSLRVYDQEHDFVGKIGGDQIYLNLDQVHSPNLKISVPMEIESYNGSIEQLVSDTPITDGDLRFKVGEVKSNISDLNIGAGWNAPLTMPDISLSINGATARLRKKEIEESIKRQIPELVSGMKESLQDYVNEKTPQVLGEYFNNRFQTGYLDMVKFEPFFAPEDELTRILESGEFDNFLTPNAYILGLKFKNLAIKNDHLKISIGTFMEDGLTENNFSFSNLFGRRDMYPEEVYETNKFDHDIASVLNIDIINQFIKLSCKRGYFKKIDLDSGAPIKVSNCPYVYVAKDEKELRMVAEVEDSVEGFFKSKVVRNPLRVKFEAGLKLELSENGLYNLKLTKLYEDSVRIEDKYIRVKMFRKAVINAAKKMIKDLNKEYTDYELYNGVPLPDWFYGIKLKNLGVRYHKNGYIILYLKTIL